MGFLYAIMPIARYSQNSLSLSLCFLCLGFAFEDQKLSTSHEDIEHLREAILGPGINSWNSAMDIFTREKFLAFSLCLFAPIKYMYLLKGG